MLIHIYTVKAGNWLLASFRGPLFIQVFKLGRARIKNYDAVYI